jgi:muconolactone delta-isomerase
MRGTFLLLAAVPITVGFIPAINFGRAPLYYPTRASRDAAAEDSGAQESRIDAVAAQRDGVERQADGAEATDDTSEDVEDTAEEDADAAILRELEDEVTRLDAARQECERTIERLFAELDAAQIQRAKATQAYERTYNRYMQTKGIQEQLQASRQKAEVPKQSLDGVDVVAAAAALKSRPQSAPIAGSYVPDGLSADEWAELQARERAPKGDLGKWGSAVGGESEPQRGDLMSQPTIWTNPSAFFNERVAGEPSIQSDESRPNIFDLADEDESEDNG